MMANRCFHFVVWAVGLLIGVKLCLGQKSGYLIPPGVDPGQTFDKGLMPTVMIATLVRNKASTLPYFLTTIENLDYPKERIAIWIKSDHNEDNTTEILRFWSQDVRDWAKYHAVSIDIVDSPPYRQRDQDSAFAWSTARFQHIMRLKEEAIRVARKMWADYIFFLDADVFLVNNQTLKHLVGKKKDLVAPMLVSGSLYSNFWRGMKDYYYERTEDYKEIVEWKKTGCFQVPLIHSAILMNVRKKELPNFKPVNDTVPEDDIIRFAVNAQTKGIPMEVCNDIEYGFIMSPQDEKSTFETELMKLQNLRIEAASYWEDGLPISDLLSAYSPPKLSASSLGFDEVYMINLKRRPDRLTKMDHVLEILGIDYTLIEAVDGQELSHEGLDEMGIRQLESYRDPYHKRVMTFGEIGCFLSHYKIWEHMVKYFVGTALVLEDDVRFEPYFVEQLQRVFEETSKVFLDWDLIYLGRKKSNNADEPWVEGSQYLVHVDYTYWTIGYALTLRGAKKLLAAKPLPKLVPVDEFLPIMYDRNLNDTWKIAFETRDLKAYSAEPLLVFPTHYTSEAGYVSDTEKSATIITASANCTITKDEL